MVRTAPTCVPYTPPFGSTTYFCSGLSYSATVSSYQWINPGVLNTALSVTNYEGVVCPSDTNTGGWLADGFTLTLYVSCPTFECNPLYVPWFASCASAHLHADAVGLASPGSLDLYDTFNM